jgi:CubicO group peptidase (beta-lactamase class C family)
MPRMIRAIAALAVAAVFMQAAGDGWTRVLATYRDLLQRSSIVGSGLIVLKDGAVVGKAFEGFQDLEPKRPVDEHTIFHWASITKTFTGVAIMQLRDRRLLSLDDPVVKFVPELRQVHNPYGDIAQVTIRHLMSHSGGFRSSTWPWGGDRPWHPFEPTRWEQLVAMLPYTDVQFRPGSEYRYSNPGIVFLGRIIEQLSGDEYETYIAKNILMPLAMTRTFFDRAPYHLRAHRSHSYVRTDGKLAEQPFDFDTGITASNGGLNAPLGDMAVWLGFLIGETKDSARRGVYEGVLARRSVDEMFTPVIKARDGEGGSGADVQAGLSCFIERHHGVELVGHSGDQNGFISHLYLHRPTRSGYLVSFNTNSSSKTDPSATTRAADDRLRDVVIEQLISKW